MHESLMLPWEIEQETTLTAEENIPVFFTDDDLMDKILALSSQESTFLEPFQNQGENLYDSEDDNPEKREHRSSADSFSMAFVMDAPRIKLIRRLMDIDRILASEHSRFSGEYCTVP